MHAEIDGVNENPVGNRLAGDGDSKDPIAGKPVSYGSVMHADIDGINAIRWYMPKLMALTQIL